MQIYTHVLFEDYNNKIQNLFWSKKNRSFWNLLSKHSKWLDCWKSSPLGKGTVCNREFLHHAWAYMTTNLSCALLFLLQTISFLHSRKWPFTPCPSTIKMLNTQMWRKKNMLKQNVKPKHWNGNLDWNSLFVWTKEMLALYKNSE